MNRPRHAWFYLHADGISWSSDEMRTHDGGEAHNWLHHAGPFFKTPGATFRGDLDLANDPSDAIRGELHFRGLELSTTLRGAARRGTRHGPHPTSRPGAERTVDFPLACRFCTPC